MFEVIYAQKTILFFQISPFAFMFQLIVYYKVDRLSLSLEIRDHVKSKKMEMKIVTSYGCCFEEEGEFMLSYVAELSTPLCQYFQIFLSQSAWKMGRSGQEQCREGSYRPQRP